MYLYPAVVRNLTIRSSTQWTLQVCVLYSLALRCPAASVQQSLEQLVAPYVASGGPLEDLLMRKSSNIYGMRVLRGIYGVPTTLARMGVSVIVEELEASYEVRTPFRAFLLPQARCLFAVDQC